MHRKLFPLLLLLLIATAVGCTTNWMTFAADLRHHMMDARQRGQDGQSERPVIHGDAARGEDIFIHGVNGSPPCVTCHARTPGAFTIGPVLQGVGERAGTRIAGTSAEDYLRQSILDPAAYLVPGFRNIMYNRFAEVFDDQDVADLIAYLLTL